MSSFFQDNKSEYGYLYCMSNPSFKDDLLKIGQTNKHPEVRKYQLNNSSGLPYDFKVEIYKYVKNYKEREKTIHKILEQYRMNKEFFKVDLDTVKNIFNLMDDQMEPFEDENQTPFSNNFEEKEVQQKEVYDTVGIQDTEENVSNSETLSQTRSQSKTFNRDPSTYFYDNQKIRHKITKKVQSTRIATYSKETNDFIYENEHMNLNSFVKKHYKEKRPDRCSEANAWFECECQTKQGEWIKVWDIVEH